MIGQLNSGGRVSYFQHQEMAKYSYSKEHPMKPKRIAMAHSLINSYHLYRELDVYLAREAHEDQITQFHSQEYAEYLKQFVDPGLLQGISSWGMGDCASQIVERWDDSLVNQFKFNIRQHTDCPPFIGLYNYCRYSAGASIDCARLLIDNSADVAINWGGGLHHAKKCEASGFCYVNDIVLCIVELLREFPRVLYVDLDVHHGDGVEQAFFLSNRVMTVSFHQFQKDFFPGTGNLDSVGAGEGKHYSVNVPLKSGINDETYFQLFKTVMDRVLSFFRPHALVVQLGADSLSNDRLGRFNLSVRGHGSCLNHLLRAKIPTVMLGGGGYTVANVARCWAFQTGVALGLDIQEDIPKTDLFIDMYEPDLKLHLPVKQMQNKNSSEQLQRIKEFVFQSLRHLQFAPGVQLHNIPQSFLDVKLEPSCD